MKSKNFKLIIILLIIITCTGCVGSSSSNKGTYRTNCYYNDEGEEFCVKEYNPPERDNDPYVRY